MSEALVVSEAIVCLRPCNGLKALFPKSSLFMAVLQSSVLLMDASCNNKALLKITLPHEVSVVDCVFLKGAGCFVLATSDSSVMVVPIEQGQLESGGGSGVIQGESIVRKKWKSQPRILKPIEYPLESNSSTSETPRTASMMVSCDDGSLAVVSIGDEINGFTCPCPALSFKNSLGTSSVVLSVDFAYRDVILVAYGFDASREGEKTNSSGKGMRTRKAKDKQMKESISLSSNVNTTYGGIVLAAWRVAPNFGASSSTNWFDYTKRKKTLNKG